MLRILPCRSSRLVCCNGVLARQRPTGCTLDDAQNFSARRRGFATAVFNISGGQSGAEEQVLFVLGLNQRKFFGQDGSEEGLKLLERIVEHDPKYHLLLGLQESALTEVEADYKVKDGRLTPTRDLENERNGEMIPLVQAAMVDGRPRRALDRPARLSQGRVAWQLWRFPRECLKMSKHFWNRNKHKDAAALRYWSEHFPIGAFVYYGERAELIATRAMVHLGAQREKGRGGASVLVVHNDVFSYVKQHIGDTLEEDAHTKLSDPLFLAQLQTRSEVLCTKYPDLTSLLLFVYIGLPMLLLHHAWLAIEFSMTHAPGAKVGLAEWETDRE